MMSANRRRWSATRLVAGAFRRLWSLVPQRPRPTILMYHRIAEDSFDPWGLAVNATNFADQLRWLSANRALLALDEFAAARREGSLADTAVAVTFDDGYACCATVAAPLLEQHGVPATIFLPVELIERGGSFWWDELECLVLESDRQSLHIEGEVVPLGAKQGDDAEWRPGSSPRTPRQKAFHRLWALLRRLPPSQLDEAMARLRDEARVSIHGDHSKRPMSPEEVRKTISAKIKFGSHALTHPWLTSLDSDEKAREICDSVDRCEALTGSCPSAFAYPYGNFDEESELLAEQAGFACACATGGSAISTNSRLFALPRVQVGNWSGNGLGRALARTPH